MIVPGMFVCSSFLISVCMFIVSKALLISSATVIVRAGGAIWLNPFATVLFSVVVVYPLPWPLLVGGVRCSRLWSTSQLLRPSGQQCSHSGGVCPQIQGRQCGAYVGAVEEMMCVVCVDVTEGA